MQIDEKELRQIGIAVLGLIRTHGEPCQQMKCLAMVEGQQALKIINERLAQTSEPAQ